jgi:hypothetical protein
LCQSFNFRVVRDADLIGVLTLATQPRDTHNSRPNTTMGMAAIII